MTITPEQLIDLMAKADKLKYDKNPVTQLALVAALTSMVSTAADETTEVPDATLLVLNQEARRLTLISLCMVLLEALSEK